jgi:ferric-dicitrate binding protein FerR (iron transport regulator)
MQHPENRIWNLLALKLSGEATSDDLIELNKYLDNHLEIKNTIDSIEAFWNQAGEILKVTDEMEEERFHLILDAENKEEIKNENDLTPVKKLSKPFNYKWLYAAASVIFILGMGFLLERNSDSNSSAPKNLQQVYVKPGSKSQIILPDGTVVRLNSSSKLSYHKDFNKKVREVDLEGEAYFDVTKDAAHPFIVHTSNIDIRVLGTRFNVKCYEQDHTIETTLLRGSIEVYNKDDPSAPKVILKPNEKLVFRKDKEDKVPLQKGETKDSLKRLNPDQDISISTLSANKPDSLKEETSWLYNRLVINGDDFNNLATKLERWYGVKIEILSQNLAKYHFNGIFENETIEQALAALQLTVKFKYEMKDDVIEIKE